jgi:hypothetical protein
VTQLLCEFGSEVTPSRLTRVVTFHRPGRGPAAASAYAASANIAAIARAGAARLNNLVKLEFPIV